MHVRSQYLVFIIIITKKKSYEKQKESGVC